MEHVQKSLASDMINLGLQELDQFHQRRQQINAVIAESMPLFPAEQEQQLQQYLPEAFKSLTKEIID